MKNKQFVNASVLLGSESQSKVE